MTIGEKIYKLRRQKGSFYGRQTIRGRKRLQMKISIFRSVQCVFLKEIICGMRFKAVWAVMLMFSLTTLSCVSLAIRGMGMEPSLLAALLCIILFFSAMAGSDSDDNAN